jgi:hypothetical protein
MVLLLYNKGDNNIIDMKIKQLHILFGSNM